MEQHLRDSMGNISAGDDALLYLDGRRTYLVRVEDGKQLHTHKGYLNLGELIGLPFGSPLRSSLGATFYALRPMV